MPCGNMRRLLRDLSNKTIHHEGRVTVAIFELTQRLTFTLIN